MESSEAVGSPLILSMARAGHQQERYTCRENGRLHGFAGPGPSPLEVQTHSPVLDIDEIIYDLSSKSLFLLRPVGLGFWLSSTMGFGVVVASHEK